MSLLQELDEALSNHSPYFRTLLQEYCRDIIENYNQEIVADEYVLEAASNQFRSGEIEKLNEGHILSGVLYDPKLFNKFSLEYHKRVPHRYSDPLPYSNRKYWYFTTHGVGPGTIPKDLSVLSVKEGQNDKGTQGTFILLDGCLNDDEISYYDLRELSPTQVMR